MGKYKRVFIVVIDSLGIGSMPDADSFGDNGADTLGHIAETAGLRIPNLRRLGLANLRPFKGLPPCESPLGYRMVLELSLIHI